MWLENNDTDTQTGVGGWLMKVKVKVAWYPMKFCERGIHLDWIGWNEIEMGSPSHPSM